MGFIQEYKVTPLTTFKYCIYHVNEIDISVMKYIWGRHDLKDTEEACCKTQHSMILKVLKNRSRKKQPQFENEHP